MLSFLFFSSYSTIVAFCIMSVDIFSSSLFFIFQISFCSFVTPEQKLYNQVDNLEFSFFPVIHNCELCSLLFLL